MANLTLRQVKGSPLTIAEMDGNFEYFTGSHAITGSLIVTGGITGSISNATSASYLNPLSQSVQLTGSLNISGSVTIGGILTVDSSIVLSTTQSSIPSWTGTDGEIIPATVGGQYFLYMWMNGSWRSGSFV